MYIYIYNSETIINKKKINSKIKFIFENHLINKKYLHQNLILNV